LHHHVGSSFTDRRIQQLCGRAAASFKIKRTSGVTSN
jgi:hypothetical protein